MTKNIKKLPTLLLGMIIGAALTAGSVVGASAYLKATKSNVKLVVDGTQAKLSDSPLNVNGKLYLPVRDTANVLGYSVQSVTSSTVTLKENTTSKTNNTGTTSTDSTTNSNANNSTTSKTVKNLKETYSNDGKLDATKIRTALDNKSLDLNSKDSDTGNTLLHYAILENNFEAFRALKRNALDPNVQNSDGDTPLHIAVKENSSFYLGELKELKANAKIKNNEGKLPIDYAKKNSPNYISLEIYML
ncbi:ankyrin repeat domain-containing protein [Paenibacillus lactis]|uniref:ankyrin repeat domain-containing protein n=1 Tax=Paenibacillus lactis TaxID=228574 RepID=UPI003D73DC9B